MNNYEEIRNKASELFEKAWELEKQAWRYQKEATLGEINDRIDNSNLQSKIEYKLIVEDNNYECFERNYNLYYYVYGWKALKEFELESLKREIKDTLTDDNDIEMCGQSYIYVNRIYSLDELFKLEDDLIIED